MNKKRAKQINSNCTNEFLWRVPKSWTWFAENVQIVDSIFCETKFGVSPVIITKIKVLDMCPVDFVIKRVAEKEIRRNGCIIKPINKEDYYAGIDFK